MRDRVSEGRDRRVGGVDGRRLRQARTDRESRQQSTETRARAAVASSESGARGAAERNATARHRLTRGQLVAARCETPTGRTTWSKKKRTDIDGTVAYRRRRGMPFLRRTTKRRH